MNAAVRQLQAARGTLSAFMSRSRRNAASAAPLLRAATRQFIANPAAFIVIRPVMSSSHAPPRRVVVARVQREKMQKYSGSILSDALQRGDAWQRAWQYAQRAKRSAERRVAAFAAPAPQRPRAAATPLHEGLADARCHGRSRPSSHQRYRYRGHEYV